MIAIPGSALLSWAEEDLNRAWRGCSKMRGNQTESCPEPQKRTPARAYSDHDAPVRVRTAAALPYFLAGAAGVFTLLDSQARPSSRPSPVVAQLGTTNHILSFSWFSLRASVTSCGFIAVVEKSAR